MTIKSCVNRWFQVSLYCIVGCVSLQAVGQGRVEWVQWHDIRLAIDFPEGYNPHEGRELNLVLYALPNGNSIEWTMGKLLTPADDWHYDIQHIAAQSAFVRKADTSATWVMVYLETAQKSWPAWKAQHENYITIVQSLVDTIRMLAGKADANIYLNGHSGGGRFVFSYLDGVDTIPAFVHRISFLDSNYGYEEKYYTKFRNWLQNFPESSLQVFAYNDSVALLNGKRFVSDTGGTWFRSHLMVQHFSRDFKFDLLPDDSVHIMSGLDGRIRFYLKENPAKTIWHTVQVERNGFIHSLLTHTPEESKGYQYLRVRAYQPFIKPTVPAVQ